MILPEHKPSLLRQKTPPEREAFLIYSAAFAAASFSALRAALFFFAL